MLIGRRYQLAAMVCLFTATSLVAKPTDGKIAAAAAYFHQFRIATLAKANQLDLENPLKNIGAKYVARECERFARQTSPEYLYGIVEDLIEDTSRTEEPYLIAIMVLDNYPPDTARRVVTKIIADPKYDACSDVKNWLWEIDEAQKQRSTR